MAKLGEGGQARLKGKQSGPGFADHPKKMEHKLFILHHLLSINR